MGDEATGVILQQWLPFARSCFTYQLLSLSSLLCKLPQPPPPPLLTGWPLPLHLRCNQPLAHWKGLSSKTPISSNQNGPGPSNNRRPPPSFCPPPTAPRC